MFERHHGREVVQHDPARLRTQVFGISGGAPVPLLADPAGRLNIRPLSSGTDSILVQGTVTANTRALTNTVDSVLVYGNNGTSNQVIRTDASGNVETVLANPLTSTSDSILIYGNDGTTNRVIRTDASGNVETVLANPLTNTADSILIYGNDGTTNRVIRTDASGNIQTVSSKGFVQAAETVTTSDTLTGSTPRNISLLNFPTVSFYVGNTSATNFAEVSVQISPDGVNWVDLGGTTVAGNGQAVLTPSSFLQYARVAFQSSTPGFPATLVIIFQAQT
ncbi:Hypothetical protein LUCI_5096 [Lucifera butyrica]|uniref:DUF6385 domain-containing protein n=1 Tax=Lucifera butyrica TaxID=1351585 RepID=A0A498RL66_9FIRM|nr:DUF6385 domain-containing protein [Lucifera butyrica]VBB09798.1 Hypothetical protein LUCI_5096 [Lucifera butyrica]